MMKVNLLTKLLTGNVMTGDETDMTKFIIIGIVCVVLVVGVTVLGKVASKSDEQDVEENNEETEEK